MKRSILPFAKMAASIQLAPPPRYLGGKPPISRLPITGKNLMTLHN
jgi:hypothetical protein